MKKEQLRAKKLLYVLMFMVMCTIGCFSSKEEVFAARNISLKFGGEVTTKRISGKDFKALKKAFDWSGGTYTTVNIMSSDENLTYTIDWSNSEWDKKDSWLSVSLIAHQFSRDKNGNLKSVKFADGEWEKGLAGSVFENGKATHTWGDPSVIGLESGDFSSALKQYGYQDNTIFTLRFLRYNKKIEAYQWIDYPIVYDCDDEQIFHYDKVENKITVEGAEYKITKSGEDSKEVTYVQPKNSKKKSVTVPATVVIDGQTYKVTAIANKAFEKNSKLKSVIIGENVKKIGKEAFYKCKNLKKITIKSTVLKTVGKNAVKGIHQKATIKVPKKQYKTYKSLFKSKTGYAKTMKIKK